MASQHVLTALVLWAGYLAALTKGDTIRSWIPNGNFENLDNWDPPVAPCSNDRLIFNSSDGDAHVSVIIQKNHTIRELVLPETGSLLFGEDASLEFSSVPDRTRGCSRLGKDILYVGGKPHQWFSPGNWCPGRDCSSTVDAPVRNYVDMERVPCQYDQAVFPEPNFVVDVRSQVPISLDAVEVRGHMYYDTGEFQTFTTGVDGKHMFVTSEAHRPISTFTLTNTTCPYPDGCVCDNFHHQIESVICEQAGLCPTEFPCTTKVKVTGDCCFSCGSLLRLSILSNASVTNATFDFESFAENITSHDIFNQTNFKNVSVSVTRIPPLDPQNSTAPIIEIGAKDRGQGLEATKALCQLREFLLDRDVQLELAVEHIAIKTSDGKDCYVPPPPPTSQPNVLDPSGPYFAWIIVGIIIVFLVLMAFLSFIVFFFYRRRSAKSSVMEMDTVMFDGHSASVQQGFDNPLYGEPTAFDEDEYAVSYNVGEEKITGLDDPAQIEVNSGLPSPTRHPPSNGQLEIVDDSPLDAPEETQTRGYGFGRGVFKKSSKPKKEGKSKKEEKKESKRSSKRPTEGFDNPNFEGSPTVAVVETIRYRREDSDVESGEADSPMEEELTSPSADPRIDIPDKTKIVQDDDDCDE